MEQDRIGFWSPDIRDQFFDCCRSELGFDTWDDLSAFVGLRRTTFERYRYGQNLLPGKMFFGFLNLLSSPQKTFFLQNTFSKSACWGQILGGHRTSALHPEIIVNARIHAKENISRKPSHNFDLTQELSPELCEFIGAFIGDGFTNRYGRHFFIGFAGHAKLDYGHYEKTIIPFAKKLFNFQGCSVWEKGNAMRVTFHSKRLFEMLTQRFQLPAGVKSYTVLIPKEILDSTPQNIAAVLRGMFDTDGCVFFDNRKAYKVPYMRIVLTMKNPPILAQVVEVLARLGIHGHISRGRDVHIIAREDIDQFLRVVGFSNPKHIDKVLKAYPDFEEYNPGTRRNQLLAVE